MEELLHDVGIFNKKEEKPIVTKLQVEQIDHANKLIDILMKTNLAMDLSETGVGKTYIACSICAALKRKPLIICPKSLIGQWRTVCSHFSINYVDIINIEAIRNGKTYQNNRHIISHYYDNGKWAIDDDILIIIDEAQKCKNASNMSGKLLMSLKKYKILLLSATIANNLSDLGVIYHLLGYGKKSSINKIKHIVKNHGSRILLSDLSKMPNNKILVKSYSGDVNGINESKINIDNMQKIKMKLELLKVDVLIKLCKKYRSKNYSVVIFVNFIKTMNELIDHFDNNEIDFSLIYGKQTVLERNEAIDLFQSNKCRTIICQMKAGSVGISLNDIDGNFKRVSLITLTDSASTLIQALGRIYRSGTQSDCLSIIITIKNALFEDNVKRNLNAKIDNISKINDSDLSSNYNIDFYK